MVTTIITAMAAYSNERVAAIVISVLYRMLTLDRKDNFYLRIAGLIFICFIFVDYLLAARSPGL